MTGEIPGVSAPFVSDTAVAWISPRHAGRAIPGTLEKTAMRAHFRLRPQHVRNVLSLTVAASLLPAGTAFAQSASSVKVTKEKVEVVSSLNALGEVVMTAPRGTVFEVLDTEGDRYSYRKSNWYWVLL